MKKLLGDMLKGIWKENPVLVLLLGTCPTLATTSSAANGLAMGLATTAVLCCSNAVISSIAGIVPKKIRIPVYIVVIATFVSSIDMLMMAYAPPVIYASLGIFIPLIVVNCIVLGRAEAFASKHGPVRSFFDGLGMGIGFSVTLTLLGALREFISTGSVFEIKIITCWTTDFLLASAAPGAFIILGVILAAKNFFAHRAAVKAGKLYVPPAGLDCHSCRICKIDEEK